MSVAHTLDPEQYERPIVPTDEFNHVPHPPDNWRENCWLTFFDVKNDLRAIVYQNLQPMVERGFALVMVFRGDQPIYIFNDDRLSWATCSHDERRSGPVTFTCLEPWKRWRVQVSHGGLDLDVVWDGLCDAFDFGWGPLIGSRHYEQSVRVTGRIVLGDEHFAVEALGQRDHAWGHRDPAGMQRAWSGRAFFSETEIQQTALVKVRDELFMFGSLLRNGEQMLLDRIDLHVVHAHDGGPPLSTELRAWNGDALIIDQQVRVRSAVGNAGVRGNQQHRQFYTFSEFTDGMRSTVGQLDYWWAAPLSTARLWSKKGNDGMWVTV